MAYTVPTTASGQVLTSAIWNASVRDNIIYLQDRLDNPARASVYHSATQSIATGSDTAVAFDTEIADSAGLHDTAINNSRLTVPTGQGGWWMFTASVEFAANATGQRKIWLRRGGTDFIQGWSVDATAAGTTRLGFAMELAVVAGDYFEVMVMQNSGGALNLSSLCYFTGRRAA